MKDFLALLAFLAGLGALAVDPLRPVAHSAVFFYAFFALLFDAYLLTPWGRNSSRVAPLLVLALLLEGSGGLAAGAVSLLVGGLLLSVGGHTARKLGHDLARTLAPLASVWALRLSLPEPLPVLSLALGFVLLSLVFEPRRYALRPTLLTLFCAPWVALSGHALVQQAPWSVLFLVPLLAGLSRGRDESFPLLVRLRQALAMSQEMARTESQKARRFQHLLQSANAMAQTLEPEKLRRALVRAAEGAGASEVRVFLPGESPSGPGLDLLEGRARLCFAAQADPSEQDQLAILARVFSTCWENAELHRRVLDALEETKRSQAQLVESSRLRAMGLMAAGVAHEVNTPLGAIQLSAELIEACLARKPEDVPKHLLSIERATERARKAVQRILYYARPIGEEQAEEFRLGEVVDDALDLLSHRVARTGVVVHSEVEESIVLMGERQAFFSFLFNLILNGVEATNEAKEPQVWLRAGRTAEKIVVEVEDNGPGVPPEIVSRIFEPFFTTRPSGEGTGLGLHLARGAVESFGGRLGLIQSRGRGAIFRAEFPRQI